MNTQKPELGQQNVQIGFTTNGAIPAQPGTRWQWPNGVVTVVMAFAPIMIQVRTWVSTAADSSEAGPAFEDWSQPHNEQRIGPLVWNPTTNALVAALEGRLLPPGVEPAPINQVVHEAPTTMH